MSDFHKWRTRTVWFWALWAFLALGALYIGYVPAPLDTLLITGFTLLLMASMFVNFNACFSRCNDCQRFIVSPAHFWVGTVVFTNPDCCPHCGSHH